MESSLNVNRTPVLQATLPVLTIGAFLFVGFLLLLYRTPPSMRDLLQAVAKRGGWLKAWRPEVRVEKRTAPETATIPVAQAPPEAEQGKQPGADEEAPLFVRIMDAYHQQDRGEVDELTDQFIHEASNDDERVDRQGWQLYFQFRLGDTSALPRLGALVQRFPDNPSLTEFMALSYSVSGEHNRAATLYRQAADKTQEEEDKVRLTIQTAEEFRQAGLEEQAVSELKELIPSITLVAQRARVYAALADAERDRVEPDRAAELYEQSLQENPGNAEVRFKLAYLYGDMGRHELSLFHYQKLRHVPAERAGEAINNLAIEYSRLEMPIKAVRTYTLAF
jgi:tetratricopeptide (TPR) repeat protein